MSSPVLASAAPRSTRLGGPHDRAFFSGMAIALALVVLVGFGPSYYWAYFGQGLTTTISGGPFTPLVQVHAALFTSWVLLFVVQTALIATHRVRVHRRLGIVGGTLALGMVVAGTLAAIAAARRGAGPTRADPLGFLAIPLTDMLLFGGFVSAALLKRRDKDAHKRLMLLAYVSLLAAAFARVPAVASLAPPAPLFASLLPLILAMAYDRLTRGRVHRAYLWGLGAFVLSLLRVPLSGSAAWHTLAGWMVG